MIIFDNMVDKVVSNVCRTFYSSTVNLPVLPDKKTNAQISLACLQFVLTIMDTDLHVLKKGAKLFYVMSLCPNIYKVQYLFIPSSKCQEI